MNLIYSTNPLLRKVSKPVEEFDDDLRKFVKELFEKSRSLGNSAALAAIQVGNPVRLTVIDLGKEREKDEECEAEGFVNSKEFCMINPKIVWTSEEEIIEEEGCMSCPGVYAEIPRHKKIEVEYFDEYGNKKSLKAYGFLAKCIEHEIDHMDGILFIDYLSKIKQNMLFKKVEKNLKQDEKV